MPLATDGRDAVNDSRSAAAQDEQQHHEPSPALLPFSADAAANAANAKGGSSLASSLPQSLLPSVGSGGGNGTRSTSYQQEFFSFHRRLFALALGFLFFRLMYTWSRRAFLFAIASLLIAIAAAAARQFIANNNTFMAQRYYHLFQTEQQLAQQQAQQHEEEEQRHRMRMERIERERKESEAMAQEAATLMMEINRQHLQEFVNNAVGDGRPAATYEQWIAELHPENVTAETTAAPCIDNRFYLPDSDHLRLWNEVASREDGRRLEPVEARSFSLAPSSS